MSTKRAFCCLLGPLAPHSLMRVNRLEPTDDAYPADGPTILLVPVGEGAD